MEAILWVVQNIILAFYNFAYAIFQPHTWLNWANPEAVMTTIYYGASVEFFFFFLTAFLTIFGVGIWYRGFLWGVVTGLEGFANVVGRIAAWAGVLMVIQQIFIVVIQRIFLEAQISFALGIAFTKDISWFAEELKLYNAIIICLCGAYTFVQGGHVRVDLVYAAVSHKTKRLIDMFGCIVFMLPAMLVTWFYSWFFLWRHLVTPKVSASDPFDRMLMKARAMKWNVETTGFSPNGFNAYFLFKVLMVFFCLMMILQAVAFFYRSYLEYVEGEDSADKYLDRDILEDTTGPTPSLQEGH